MNYVPLSVREAPRFSRRRFVWWWSGRKEAVAVRLAPWLHPNMGHTDTITQLLEQRDSDRERADLAESHDVWMWRAKAAEARVAQIEKTLRRADVALENARCGLDLGLGCARDLEHDHDPRPTKPRSVRQDLYLRQARQYHREIRDALKGQDRA